MEGISWLHCETSNALNDYRPVALTSVDIKTFERLEKAYLKASIGPLLDCSPAVCLQRKQVCG